MQRNCIFPGRYAPLTYYEDVLRGGSRGGGGGTGRKEVLTFRDHSKATTKALRLTVA